MRIFGKHSVLVTQTGKFVLQKSSMRKSYKCYNKCVIHFNLYYSLDNISDIALRWSAGGLLRFAAIDILLRWSKDKPKPAYRIP